MLDAAAQVAFLAPVANQLVDDFDRSDRALHGDALPGTVLQWNITGVGRAAAAIVDGRFESPGHTFAYIGYEALVTRIAGVFSFSPPGPTDDLDARPLGLIVDRRTADEGLQNILHLQVGPRGWVLSKGGFQLGNGAPRAAMASGTHQLETDGRSYGIGMEISPSGVTVITPSGERVVVVDPAAVAVSTAGGAGSTGALSHAAFEITAAAGAPQGRWEAVARNR